METLTHLFSSLTYWHWLSLGVVLLILELIISSSGFLLWLSLASFVVSIASWLVPTLLWSTQLILFSLAALLSLIAWRKYKDKTAPESGPKLNRRAEQYINRLFTLVAPIVNGRGTIEVDDTRWLVAGEDLPAGAIVRVTHVDGVILNVQKVDS